MDGRRAHHVELELSLVLGETIQQNLKSLPDCHVYTRMDSLIIAHAPVFRCAQHHNLVQEHGSLGLDALVIAEEALEPNSS